MASVQSAYRLRGDLAGLESTVQFEALQDRAGRHSRVLAVNLQQELALFVGQGQAISASTAPRNHLVPVKQTADTVAVVEQVTAMVEAKKPAVERQLLEVQRPPLSRCRWPGFSSAGPWRRSVAPSSCRHFRGPWRGSKSRP